MNLEQFTLINIIFIELSFFFGKWLIKKRIFAIEFLVSFFLTLIIWGFSFGGMVLEVFQHIQKYGNRFSLTDIFLLFLNTGWTYFRGLRRIAFIKK